MCSHNLFVCFFSNASSVVTDGAIYAIGSTGIGQRLLPCHCQLRDQRTPSRYAYVII